MVHVPPNPKIYHITHLRNLPQAAEVGVIWSDGVIRSRKGVERLLSAREGKPR